MTSIKTWTSLVKFSHTIFALPFALVGFGLAYLSFPSNFNWWLLIYMLLCMIFARNAAMAFNRYIDRHFDLLNERTKNRELPSKIIKPKNVLFFIIANIFLFIITSYQINHLAFFLSPVALFVILFYSYSKRFTSLCHFILGASLAIAPIGAYIVLSNKFDIVPLFLSGAVLFWVAGFDILYSLQDEDFDKNNNLKSIPQRFGRKNALIISSISHIFSIIFLFSIIFVIKTSWFYIIGLSIFSIILIWEHLIVKPSDISRINTAFATMNAIASIIFAVFALVDMFGFYIFS